jgi:hypothetical protein
MNMKVWSESLKIRGYVGVLDIDEKIILKWILKKRCDADGYIRLVSAKIR